MKVPAKVWKKWDATRYLYNVGCDACGWQSIASDRNADKILGKHADLFHWMAATTHQ